MSVYALVLLMFSQVQYTKFSLIVKHVKIFIFNVIVDKFGLDLLLTVRICTEISVWTFRERVGPVGAETFTVALNVVLFLDW